MLVDRRQRRRLAKAAPIAARAVAAATAALTMRSSLGERKRCGKLGGGFDGRHRLGGEVVDDLLPRLATVAAGLSERMKGRTESLGRLEQRLDEQVDEANLALGLRELLCRVEYDHADGKVKVAFEVGLRRPFVEQAGRPRLGDVVRARLRAKGQQSHNSKREALRTGFEMSPHLMRAIASSTFSSIDAEALSAGSAFHLTIKAFKRPTTSKC